MTTKKVRIRKDVVALWVVITIVISMLIVLMFVPAFKTVDYEIRDNQLFVERENIHNVSMDVVVAVNNKGTVREEKVRIYFEKDTGSYVYDQEYFKEVLETEGSVQILKVPLIWTSHFDDAVSPYLMLSFYIFLIALIFLVLFIIVL